MFFTPDEIKEHIKESPQNNGVARDSQNQPIETGVVIPEDLDNKTDNNPQDIEKQNNKPEQTASNNENN